MSTINTIKRGINMIPAYLGLRKKPNFLIIGAQKAGTTSLFQYITDLSDNFVPPERKELYFFTEHFRKGIAYYRSKFPLSIDDEILTGEATPDYLFYPEAPKRIKKYFPNIKLVVILRDPVQRAFSQYQYQNNWDKTAGFDSLPFEEAIRLESIGERYTDSDKINFTYNYKYYSYIERGKYYDQLSRWYKYFDKAQILVLELNELKENPKQTVDKLFYFLGLTFKKNKQYDFPVSNKSPIKGSDINSSTNLKLKTLFKNENDKLFQLIGKKFDWE